MKNKLTTLIPAVALLALSSCASTTGLTSTESDGVYYSSKDRTTQTATASSSYESTGQSQSQVQGIDEDTNPEYSTSRNGNTDSGSNTEYYDDSYASRLGRFNGSSYSGLSYYSPVYTDPYFSGGYSAFSPYGMGYYDPFYSPYGFGSPFGYGLGGSSLSLSFGNFWGRPSYGLGGFGGYGGYYDSFYNPYYGGLYGGLYGGYYGGRGYGYSNYGNGNAYYGGGNDNGRRATLYAPRRDRTREAMSAGQPQPGRGRLNGATSVGGMTAESPAGAANNAAPVATGRSRGRILDAAPSQQQTNGATAPGNYNVNERAMSNSEQRAREGRGRLGDATTTTPSGTTAEQPRIDYSGRRRMQQMDNGSGGSTAAPQDYAQPQPQRRSRLSEAFRTNTNTEQSAPQRTYSQPTRSYEPQMSSPAPSSSGSNFGGGSSSGGGGGGGRGRIR